MSDDKKNRLPNKWTRALLMARNVSFFVCLAILTYQFWQAEQDDYVVTLPSAADDAVVVPQAMMPPQHDYSHPVAQRLVDIGTALVDDPRDRHQAARQLHVISNRADLLGEDHTTYLALRAAYWQLRHDPDPNGSIEAAMLIWDAADRLESAGHIASADLPAD